MSEQSRIYPYNINTILNRQVMRIEKNFQTRGLFVDPIPSPPNYHYKNCTTDNKKNY